LTLAAPFVVLAVYFVVLAVSDFAKREATAWSYVGIVGAAVSMWFAARFASAYVRFDEANVVVHGVLRTRVLARAEVGGVVRVPRFYGGSGLDLVLAGGRKVGVPASLIPRRGSDLDRLEASLVSLITRR
jgi:hypothetical protein